MKGFNVSMIFSLLAHASRLFHVLAKAAKPSWAGRWQHLISVSGLRIKPILDFEQEMRNAKTYCDADPFNSCFNSKNRLRLAHFTFMKHLRCLFASMLLFGLMACATGGNMDMDSYPVHTFSFDTHQDSPDVEVLDYQYSNSRHAGIRPERERVLMGQTFGGTNIAGSILRGDFLYVKWRVKKPGTLLPEYLGTYEDTVDMKSRLPADITHLRIHFIIKGPQLYVYLIWPYDAKHEYPLGELKHFGRVKQLQIYPDQSN